MITGLVKTDFCQTVIIIGAGRSGTNMLRDILVQLPGFGTWPCDEINYIWRHGNVRETTDEFGSELATGRVQSFIHQAFNRLAKRQRITCVVEKTCANSLRVGFVNQIFPEAQFIHLIRDGRDVVASAQKRWTASLDLPYIFRKARFVPVSDLPYYSLGYLGNRIYRLRSSESRLASWGPRFVGMNQLLQKYSLPEVCALQWQRCVEKAACDFQKIDPARVYQLRYEDFVTDPQAGLLRIGDFLGTEIPEQFTQQLTDGVSTKSAGKWKEELDQSTVRLIQPLIQNTLRQYDYL